MSRKGRAMWLTVIGTFVGGWVASLLGADTFSLGSVLGSTIGGVAGIYLSLRLG
jgi:hypothetical protein